MQEKVIKCLIRQMWATDKITQVVNPISLTILIKFAII